MRGSLYRRGKVWWMAYYIGAEQQCESTKTRNKRLAQKILNVRIAEIIEGCFHLPKSKSPRLEYFSRNFLDSIRHENTKKRYTSSLASLRTHFGDVDLSEITPAEIDEFKERRLAEKIRATTINRDLAVLRQMLKIAERRRLITSSPFREVEMLEERKDRRRPYILSFVEEEKLLAVAPNNIRALAVLILETGLRSGKEALALKWTDIDFAQGEIRVGESKTVAGIRTVPMSNCSAPR